MKIVLTFFMACTLCLGLLSPALSATRVRLQLKWYHQAQFAGFYVAREKHFYRELGLEVDLVEGGPGINPIRSLIEKRTAFSVSSPEDLLVHTSQGQKVTAISAIYRKSAVVFLSHLSSGLRTPGSFAGKVIAVKSSKGIPDFKIQFDALIKNMGVDRSGMRLVPYDPDYKSFVSGAVDITPAYFTGGLIKLNAKQVKVNIIYPGDYRVRFYSDTLMTTNRLIRKNPDLVSRVVLATMRGWKYAIEQIDESVPMIMKYARIKDTGLQKQMLEAAVPLIHTGVDHLGWMRAEEWQHMYQILLDQQILAAPIKTLEAVFTNRFIEKMVSEGAP